MAVSNLDVGSWLRAETPEHLALLTKLRERITLALEPQVVVIRGQRGYTPAEVLPSGTPTRDWCRAYQAYNTGYNQLQVEQRERAKLLVLAQSKGQSPLTDEEYELELHQLGMDAVREMGSGELAAEIARRGLTPEQLVVPPERDD